jgi:hypothetical protein
VHGAEDAIGRRPVATEAAYSPWKKTGIRSDISALTASLKALGIAP